MNITISSFSGGQCKTTLALFLARELGSRGKKILCLDLDPQASLTQFCAVGSVSGKATAFELLNKEALPSQCIIETVFPGVSLVPADQGLEEANDYLAGTGAAAAVLKLRLKSILNFDFIIIDSPPQGANLSLTALGAADTVIIPAEANIKGVQSVLRTLDVIDELQPLNMSNGKVLGLIPVRDRWIGNTQTLSCADAITHMRLIAEQRQIKLFPSFWESNLIQRCLANQASPAATGKEGLLFPFVQIANDLIGVSCHAS